MPAYSKIRKQKIVRYYSQILQKQVKYKIVPNNQERGHDGSHTRGNITEGARGFCCRGANQQTIDTAIIKCLRRRSRRLTGTRSGSKKNSTTGHLQFTSAQSVAACCAAPGARDLPQQDSEDESTSGWSSVSNL